jgi:hypothetical protein
LLPLGWKSASVRPRCSLQHKARQQGGEMTIRHHAGNDCNCLHTHLS